MFSVNIKTGTTILPSERWPRRPAWEQQIGTHGLISGFHLGDARLARTETPRHFCLRETQVFTPSPKPRRKGQLRFDEPAFIVGQPEEVAGITHRPPRS